MICFEEIPKYSFFKEPEKTKIKETILLFKDLAKKVQNSGLEILHDELKTNSLLQENFPGGLIKLVSEGCPEGYIVDFGKNIIASTPCSDSEKLVLLVSLNGTLGILDGDNPELIATELLGMLGFENYVSLREEFVNSEVSLSKSTLKPKATKEIPESKENAVYQTTTSREEIKEIIHSEVDSYMKKLSSRNHDTW